MQVDYVSHMGSDLQVVNAARVSFNKHKDKLDASDIRLVDYLAKHNHWTPFSHCTATVRVKAPIFVRTQCFKHKVGFTENEVSRRYVDSKPEIYRPWFRQRNPNTKQGSLLEEPKDLAYCDRVYVHLVAEALDAYEDLLAEGVAPEIARTVLPQSTYTEWYWTGSLAAFARFYKLRSAPDAQYEIQELSGMVRDTIAPLFPYSWEALVGNQNLSE